MGYASALLWRELDRYEAAGRPHPAVIDAVLMRIQQANVLLEMTKAS